MNPERPAVNPVRPVPARDEPDDPDDRPRWPPPPGFLSPGHEWPDEPEEP